MAREPRTDIADPSENQAVRVLRTGALRNLMEALLTEIEDLDARIGTPSPEGGEPMTSFREAVERYEKRLIRTALIYTKGNQRQAARILDLNPTTLHTKLKRYGIDCGVYAVLDPGGHETPFR